MIRKLQTAAAAMAVIALSACSDKGEENATVVNATPGDTPVADVRMPDEKETQQTVDTIAEESAADSAALKAYEAL